MRHSRGRLERRQRCQRSRDHKGLPRSLISSFLFTFYGRARASARSDHYVFALFFRIPFFLFFIFCHEICRKVIVSNAFAYGTEIWQVDSLWKYADRMFISHKSAEGFQRGRDAYHTFLAFLACRHGWRWRLGMDYRGLNSQPCMASV